MKSWLMVSTKRAPPGSASSAQRDHLSAVRHDRGAGHKAPGIGSKQQQRTIEIARFAKAANGNVAFDGDAAFGRQIIAVHFGDDPSRRNGVDANTFEREFERQRL